MAMSSEEVIRLYENVSTLTRQMLSAARSNDWDALHRLEQACADQVEVLRHGQPAAAPALPAELRARKVRLLQAILADDREIRNITEPSLHQLSRLLQGVPQRPSQRDGHNGHGGHSGNKG
ncbi:MAG TPA: flagellar protein FliT, partial [Noviherbaspirillum sp.]